MLNTTPRAKLHGLALLTPLANSLTTFAAKVALTGVLAIPTIGLGQEHHHYKLIDLGTFGGPTSFTQAPSQAINNQGSIAGCADTSLSDTDYLNTGFLPSPPAPDPFIFHAFQWQNGALTDLRALAGPNSSCANWISENGLVAGVSENGAIDPLTGFTEVRAVLWKGGQPMDLGTLGGYESFSAGVNSRGEAVGTATNTIPDSFGCFGFGTQCRAFLFQNGVMQDLGTLGGPDSITFSGVNERGQVVGCSFTNSTPNPTTGAPTLDPFLWEKGKMVDLGTLGGASGCGLLINDRGQVMGQSNLGGDQITHAFLWERGVLTDSGDLFGGNVEPFWLNKLGDVVGNAQYPGGFPRHAFLSRNGLKMKDLGTLYPNCDSIITGSVAYGVNSTTTVVGSSFCLQPPAQDAVLWQNGDLLDLNDLVPANSSLHLVNAFGINERGEITGVGVLPNGDQHAFLLIPCRQGTEEC